VQILHLIILFDYPVPNTSSNLPVGTLSRAHIFFSEILFSSIKKYYSHIHRMFRHMHKVLNVDIK
jgi:hypothetical protein